jgi:hypothetical protein
MILTSFFTFSFCLLILVTLRISWNISKKYERNNILVDFIFFIAMVKVFFYMLLPTVLRTLSEYQFVKIDNVDLSDLVFLYCIEYLSWTIWSITFVIFMIYFKVKLYNKHIYLKKIGYRLLILLAVLYCWYTFARILDIQNSVIELLFKAILHWIGFGIGPFLLVLCLKTKSQMQFFLGLLCTTFLLLTFNYRGTIFFTIIYVLFIVYFFLKKRIYILFASILFFLIICSFIYTATVPKIVINFEDYYPKVNIGFSPKGATSGRNAFEEIEWRFGANTRMSTAFLNLYDRGEGAGINPIYNSLFGFLPRSIFPGKPHPNTVDGDNIRSQGMFIIYREIHGANSMSMVEFSTGGHYYWEFGLVGVFVLSIISGMYMAFCVKFFSTLGLVSIPLMYAVFKPTGYVEPKIWVSDIIMQIYQIVIPLIFLIVCLILFDNTITHCKKYLIYFLQPNCSIRHSKLKLLVLCTTCHDIVVFYARKLLQYLDKTRYNLRRSV